MVKDIIPLAEKTDEISSDDDHGNFEGDLKFKDNILLRNAEKHAIAHGLKYAEETQPDFIFRGK